MKHKVHGGEIHRAVRRPCPPSPGLTGTQGGTWSGSHPGEEPHLESSEKASYPIGTWGPAGKWGGYGATDSPGVTAGEP